MMALDPGYRDSTSFRHLDNLRQGAQPKAIVRLHQDAMVVPAVSALLDQALELRSPGWVTVIVTLPKQRHPLQRAACGSTDR